jgi:Spy/CpxP family protein refolding chaperone
MFGFIVGTACLIGLIKVVRHGGGWGHRGRHGFRGHLMRRLFERLDTSPGQEKVIAGAVEKIEGVVHDLRDEARNTRSEVARAIRGEVLDRDALEAVFTRHEEALKKLREAATEGLRSVHEALSPEQRRELSELISNGGLHRCGGSHWHRRGFGGEKRGVVSL